MFSGPEESYRKGFSMTFHNGWTVSVIWGSGTYSSNRDAEFDDKVPCNATLAEVGISQPKPFIVEELEKKQSQLSHPFTLQKREYLELQNKIRENTPEIKVDGWITADKVAKIIYNVSQRKGRKENE